ncbi:hypothetical protein [Teichococcus oryzae]|uniref:Uncharacterized protein n=1 Tax=Teichococcus oryzae TaxID=1608942 RepID=A0A5B2TE92_9PROT|nr:hypothetical protein [Pseudoroseomonas oryzae]KAA2212433.1 hypothetical protein F0Q34_15455 [Pseudoroseomonas oryzae]
MATEITALPTAARLRMAREALAEMARGELSERLRLELAAQILRTARRARQLTAASAALPAVMAGWDATAVTAREYAEDLSPAALDALLAEGPRWAATMLRQEPELRHAA